MTNRIRAIWTGRRGRDARIFVGRLTVTTALGFALLLCFAEVGNGLNGATSRWSGAVVDSPFSLVYGAPLESVLAQTTPTVMAVVRNQGAVLYDRPGGEPIQTLVGGSLVSVLLRSQDELWVLVRTRNDVEGWVEIGTLLAAGLSRLPVEEPTPTPTAQPTSTPIPPTPTPQPTNTPTPDVETTATAETMQPTTPEPADTGPTPTLFVPPDGPSALTLVRINGASLWRSEDGSLVARFKAGKRLSAAYRTADSAWYFVYDDSGVHGWAMAPEILVVGGSSLPIQDITLSMASMEQTESPADAMTPEKEANGASASQEVAPTATPTPTQTPTETPTPTIVFTGKIAITVNNFGARLNVRAGPDIESEIVAKAVAGVTLTGIGRNEAGDWIQVIMTALPSGVGWVYADYVTAKQPVDMLPVVEEE